MRNVAISLQGVRKMYDDFVALNEVNFDIYDNEFFTLLGPSGCGKTTLLRMISGFEPATAGRISLHGADVVDLPPHRRAVNTVFQSYALFPHMTVAENVAFGLQNKKTPKARVKSRVAEMLALVHMEEFAARLPTQLSGGQRQRVALARALAPEPEVLLLDEPLSALDLKLRQAMRNELRGLQRDTGITFVFVTHDQEEALDMSDRICVLGSGEVQQIGTPQEIYEHPANQFVSQFIGDANFIPVEVLSVAGASARVVLPWGEAIDAQANDARSGASAVLSVRPEKIALLAPGDAAPDICASGVVTQRNYMGGLTHLTIDIGQRRIHLSRVNTGQPSDALELGATVTIGFAASAARVLGR